MAAGISSSRLNSLAQPLVRWAGYGAAVWLGAALAGLPGVSGLRATEDFTAPVAITAVAPPAVTLGTGPATSPASPQRTLQDGDARRGRTEHGGNAVATQLDALTALPARERAYAEDEAVQQAAAADPRATLAWIETHASNPAHRQRLELSAYVGMSRQDPEGTLQALTAIRDDEQRALARHQVLEAWAQQDAAAAYEWLRGSDASPGEQAAVLTAYVHQAPEQAGQLIAELPPGTARTQLVERFAHRMARQDSRQALAWLSRFDDHASTAPAMATVYETWSRNEPWSAVEHAATQVEGEQAFELVAAMAAQMAYRNPAAAAVDLEKFPVDHRASVAHQIARVWSARDTAAARSWARSLPSRTVRQAAMSGLQPVASAAGNAGR